MAINPTPFYVQPTSQGAGIANGLAAFGAGLGRAKQNRKLEEEKRAAAEAFMKMAKRSGMNPQVVQTAMQASGGDPGGAMQIIGILDQRQQAQKQAERDQQETAVATWRKNNPDAKKTDIPKEFWPLGAEVIHAGIDRADKEILGLRETRTDIRDTESKISDRETLDPAEKADMDSKLSAAERRVMDDAAMMLASGMTVPTDVREQLGDKMAVVEKKAEALKMEQQEDRLEYKRKQADFLSDVLMQNGGVLPPGYEDRYEDEVIQAAKGRYERRKSEGNYIQGFMEVMRNMGPPSVD